MPTTKVIDLSDSNTIPKDLKAAKEAGVIGMIHQASSGTNLTDTKAEARIYLAEDADLLIGLYHCMTAGSAKRQADSFVSTAEALGLEDNWLLAVQPDKGTSVEDLVEFLEEVEKKTRRSPVLYADKAFLGKLKTNDRKLSKYRLWIAQHDAPAADVPTAWGRYFLWQYTDEGSVEGINPPVNCNDALIQEGENLAKAWSGFKGKTDRSAPEEDGDDDVKEPTMTDEGELDNAPADPQPEPPEVTDSGEIDKPIEGDGSATPPTASELPSTPPTSPDNTLPGQPPQPSTPDNTLPTTPSTPDNALPGSQPGIDNTLPPGAPDRPDNTLPTTPAPKKK